MARQWLIVLFIKTAVILLPPALQYAAEFSADDRSISQQRYGLNLG